MSLKSLARPLWRFVTRPVGTVRAITATQPRVVLTYDDGPDPKNTPLVLEALRNHNATATFFVLMTRARIHKSLLDEMMAAGHEIALHGVDHTRLTAYEPKEVFRRCKDGKAELEDLSGREVKWFRAPYGALLFPQWTAVKRSKLEPVGWGPTATDWTSGEAEAKAQSALDGSSAGEIILCHDGFAGPGDGVDHGSDPVLDKGKLADLLLTGLADRGMRAQSLGDTLNPAFADPARPRRWAWFLQ